MSDEVERRAYNKDEVILSGRGVTKVFVNGKVRNTAVNHVDFDFHKG